MDSLAIADVIARLERQLDQPFNPAILLRQPNLQTLTVKLYQEIGEAVVPAEEQALADDSLETAFSTILDALDQAEISLDSATSRLLGYL